MLVEIRRLVTSDLALRRIGADLGGLGEGKEDFTPTTVNSGQDAVSIGGLLTAETILTLEAKTMTVHDKLNEDRPIAAEYVLGLLEPSDAEDFEKAMKDDPFLRASYAQWAAHFANENSQIAPVSPPEHVFQNIDKAIFLNDVKEEPVITRWGMLLCFPLPYADVRL